MSLTNRDFARFAAQVARRASAWTFDTMMMGNEYWDQPTINDSAERFCKEIEDVLGWLRAAAADRR